MRRGISLRLGVLFVVLALFAVACDRGGDEGENGGTAGGNQQAGGNLYDEIVENDVLRCGVNNTVPGFGFDEGGGEIDGFDIDFCRAFAAAILGDAEKHELVAIDADNRFNALRAGEYDVLVRNTTATSSRDGAEGVTFAHPNFYDGQAMMVRDGEFSAIDEMDGTNVCVTSGTTTELNLADYAQQLGINVKPVTFAENPQLQEAFIAGRCDGWTSDRSQLAGIRSTWPNNEGGPESLVILEEIMSKEPLAPAVLDGEEDLAESINWVVNGMILAEELGVTSENVQQQAQNPDNPGIAALLGVAFEGTEAVDNGLALPNDFMQTVLEQVGNYGEVFDRHVGPNSPLGLERGINALWTKGGIQYALPIR